MIAVAALEQLKQQRPEWRPWLAVVEVALAEAASPMWSDFVPPHPTPPHAAAPRLAGASVRPPAQWLERLFDRLLSAAVRSDTAPMRSLARAGAALGDAPVLFHAALNADTDAIGAAAAARDVDAGAFQAVVALLPVPFLQACQARWTASCPEHWIQPYCPVCGAWPAFAEVRGIERTRHYRCGRCGGGWHAYELSCPFCANHDHEELPTLVPENASINAVINACKRCGGYLKAFNTLQGCAPLAVMLEDLGSAALDVAAIEQGYARPATTGYALETR